MILACLGIRPAKDIDIITNLEAFKDIPRHNEFVRKYLDINEINDLFRWQKYTFWMSYKGKSLKFLSLHTFLKLKENRATQRRKEKDAKDIELINDFMAKI